MPKPAPAEDRSDTILGNLFGDPAPVDDKPPVVEPPADDVEDDQEEIADDSEDTDPPEEEVEESDEDSEIDYDAEDAPEDKPKDDDTEDAIDKEPDPKKRESVAQKLAKENGRRVKELETTLKERDLDVERATKERDEIRARLEEIEVTRIDPRDHPDFLSLQGEIMTDVDEAAEVLVNDPTVLVNNFGKFMTAYLSLPENGKERASELANLKVTIAETLGDVPYEDLSPEEKSSTDKLVTEVLRVVQRNSGKTRQLKKVHADLSERAKKGLLSVGARDYELNVAEFKPVLDAVGDLPEDVIEENPNSPEAVVARLAKTSPEVKKRLDGARKDVMELLVGPRVLTQAEINKMESNGTDVKKFLVDRERAFRERKKRLAPLLVQALVTRSHYKQVLEKLAKLEADKDSTDSEQDALQRIKQKKAPAKPPEEKRRRDPLDALFDPED